MTSSRPSPPFFLQILKAGWWQRPGNNAFESDSGLPKPHDCSFVFTSVQASMLDQIWHSIDFLNASENHSDFTHITRTNMCISRSPQHSWFISDEAWYWLKHVLHSGWLYITSRPICKGDGVCWLLMHAQYVLYRSSESRYSKLLYMPLISQ